MSWQGLVNLLGVVTMDLNDGAVKQMHDAYLSCLKLIECFGGRREHTKPQENIVAYDR